MSESGDSVISQKVKKIKTKPRSSTANEFDNEIGGKGGAPALVFPETEFTPLSLGWICSRIESGMREVGHDCVPAKRIFDFMVYSAAVVDPKDWTFFTPSLQGSTVRMAFLDMKQQINAEEAKQLASWLKNKFEFGQRVDKKIIKIKVVMILLMKAILNNLKVRGPTGVVDPEGFLTLIKMNEKQKNYITALDQVIRAYPDEFALWDKGPLQLEDDCTYLEHFQLDTHPETAKWPGWEELEEVEDNEDEEELVEKLAARGRETKERDVFGSDRAKAEEKQYKHHALKIQATIGQLEEKVWLNEDKLTRLNEEKEYAKRREKAAGTCSPAIAMLCESFLKKEKRTYINLAASKTGFLEFVSELTNEQIPTEKMMTKPGYVKGQGFTAEDFSADAETATIGKNLNPEERAIFQEVIQNIDKTKLAIVVKGLRIGRIGFGAKKRKRESSSSSSASVSSDDSAESEPETREENSCILTEHDDETDAEESNENIRLKIEESRRKAVQKSQHYLEQLKKDKMRTGNYTETVKEKSQDQVTPQPTVHPTSSSDHYNGPVTCPGIGLPNNCGETAEKQNQNQTPQPHVDPIHSASNSKESLTFPGGGRLHTRPIKVVTPKRVQSDQEAPPTPADNEQLEVSQTNELVVGAVTESTPTKTTVQKPPGIPEKATIKKDKQKGQKKRRADKASTSAMEVQPDTPTHTAVLDMPNLEISGSPGKVNPINNVDTELEEALASITSDMHESGTGMLSDLED